MGPNPLNITGVFRRGKGGDRHTRESDVTSQGGNTAHKPKREAWGDLYSSLSSDFRVLNPRMIHVLGMGPPVCGASYDNSTGLRQP